MMWKLIDGQFYEEDAEWSETGEDELWEKEDIVELLNRYEELIDKKDEVIKELLESIESTERSREYWINQYNELIQAMIDRNIELV
ncbi:MAG: hypothetical protein J6Y78_11335 [Paludibacteraceae bacterium]|nr:hypothetical protein [Paludibacteraceae bacterium]